MTLSRAPLYALVTFFFVAQADVATSVVHVESVSYPQVARAGRVQGQVDVEVSISTSGEVESALAVSGHTLLRKAAEQNAKRWRFTASSDSHRRLKIDYVFVLDEPPTPYAPDTQTAFDLPVRVWVRSSLPALQTSE